MLSEPYYNLALIYSRDGRIEDAQELLSTSPRTRCRARSRAGGKTRKTVKLHRSILWLLVLLPVSCASDSGAEQPPPRPSAANPLSQRLNESNGYKEDANGNWVPKSDKRSSFETQGESPYFQGRIRQEGPTRPANTPKNPGGETRTTAASNTPGTPMAAASRKTPASMTRAPAKPATAADIPDTYQTDNYATNAAREAGKDNLTKPSNAETDNRRERFPTTGNHRLAASSARSAWSSRGGFWVADRSGIRHRLRERFQQQFFQRFPAPWPAFEEKRLGNRSSRTCAYCSAGNSARQSLPSALLSAVPEMPHIELRPPCRAQRHAAAIFSAERRLLRGFQRHPAVGLRIGVDHHVQHRRMTPQVLADPLTQRRAVTVVRDGPRP